MNDGGYVDNKLSLSVDSFPREFSHSAMPSGDPSLGKTALRESQLIGEDSGPVLCGRVSRWARRLVRSRILGRVNVPIGYEDETGFHFGAMTGHENSKQSPEGRLPASNVVVMDPGFKPGTSLPGAG